MSGQVDQIKIDSFAVDEDREGKCTPFSVIDHYLAISKDGVVDHDSMDASILVSLNNLVLEIVSGALAKLELDTSLGTGLCGPLCVFCGSRVIVGKEANQLGANAASFDGVLEFLSVIQARSC